MKTSFHRADSFGLQTQNYANHSVTLRGLRRVILTHYTVIGRVNKQRLFIRFPLNEQQQAQATSCFVANDLENIVMCFTCITNSLSHITKTHTLNVIKYTPYNFSRFMNGQLSAGKERA